MHRLGRLASGVVLAAIVGAAPANVASGQAHTTFGQLCQRNSNFCMAVVGQARSTTTEREITRFINSLVNANVQYGTHGIHGCETALTPAIQVTCILASSDTRQYLTKIDKDFKASHLFRVVKTRIPSA
jgi:hypothetical protein